MSDVPEGLAEGGAALWTALVGSESGCEYVLDAGQLATLEQACRMKDRCDELAALVAESGADSKAHDREQAASASLARLIAALRLPDESGKRPQRRGIRGVQQPSKVGSVSSLERARAAKPS